MTIDRRGGTARLGRVIATLATLFVLVPAAWAAAQGNPSGQPTPSPAAQPLTSSIGIEPSGESATVTFSNRPIVVLRARVLGRQPSERAAAAERALDDVVNQQIEGPVAVRAIEGSRAITVGPRAVIALTPLDIDEASGETLDEATERAAAVLRQALAEAFEARKPAALLRASLLSALALAVATFLLLVIVRGRRRIARRLIASAETTTRAVGHGIARGAPRVPCV